MKYLLLFGFSLAIAIALHDIPEGLSISLPLKKGGFSNIKAITLTAISGLTTGLGAFFGAIIGNLSHTLIGISLSFAAGAMLYIVSCEIIPESKKLYSGRFASMGNILRIYNWNNRKFNIKKAQITTFHKSNLCFFLIFFS